MVSGDVAERRRRLMVRVSRHLSCNPRNSLEEFGKTITKVIENVLNNANEIKFRELRCGNATVQNKILGVHGGRECLALLGFERIVKYQEPHYFLSEPDMQHLAEAKEWLERQVAEALRSEHAQSDQPDALACADCVVQVQLTSGKELDGGFSADEKIQAIYDFVHSSVVDGDEKLVLRQQNGADLTGEKLRQTLREAKLPPRAILAVVKPTGVALHAPPKDEAEAAAELRMLKEEHRQQKEKEAADKARLLQEFKGDREDRNMHKPAAAAAHARASDVDGVEETKGGRR